MPKHSRQPKPPLFLGRQHRNRVIRTDRLYIGNIPPSGGARIHHSIDWLSCKQNRVSFSSIGAEILAAAPSTDSGLLMAESIARVTDVQPPIPFVLSIDSHGLYSTITTLHEGADYRLRPTVARMCESFEKGEIAVMQWIPGNENIADALTKRNLSTYRNLNTTMSSGRLLEVTLRQAKRINLWEPLDGSSRARKRVRCVE